MAHFQQKVTKGALTKFGQEGKHNFLRFLGEGGLVARELWKGGGNNFLEEKRPLGYWIGYQLDLGNLGGLLFIFYPNLFGYQRGGS